MLLVIDTVHMLHCTCTALTFNQYTQFGVVNILLVTESYQLYAVGRPCDQIPSKKVGDYWRFVLIGNQILNYRGTLSSQQSPSSAP